MTLTLTLTVDVPPRHPSAARSSSRLICRPSGFVCNEGEAPQRVRAGDTVWIAPNERHWHGATSSTLMSHTTTTIGATEFHEAVAEAEYAAANATPRD